jgi:hypothetical protein
MPSEDLSMSRRRKSLWPVAVVVCAATWNPAVLQAQYCGAHCIAHSLDLLALPPADVVGLIRELNGPELDTLPTFSKLAETFWRLGAAAELVELDLVPAVGQDYTAVLHVEGNHFIVYEGRNGRVHNTWWGPGLRRKLSWKEIRKVSSPVALLVSRATPDQLHRDVLAARRLERIRSRVKWCGWALFGLLLTGVAAGSAERASRKYSTFARRFTVVFGRFHTKGGSEMKRLTLAVLLVTGAFGASPRVVDRAPALNNLAQRLVGGDECWTLPPYACPYTTYSCGTVPCTSGWFSWYCASGTYEQTAFPAYVYCTSSPTGKYECSVPDQSIWQVCATRQSCGSTCTMAVAGPSAGTYFCNGPVGPTWAVTIFPMPALGGRDCPDPVA